MTTDLLILQCDDTEHLSVLVKLNLQDSITVKETFIDKTQFPLRPSRVHEFTKCHSCLVFLSPSFINFLDRRPEQVFSVFRVLNPAKTIAVFCCGLKENQVLFHHKSPLISYDSWVRFVIPEREEVLPLALMNRLNALSEGWRNDEGRESISKLIQVNVVPSEVSSEHNHVYIIFSEHLDDLKKIHINLCGNSTLSVSTEKINPFVIRFVLPDYLIQYRGIIQVTVSYEDQVLADAQLKCRECEGESYSAKKLSNVSEPFAMSLEESMHQLQLDLLDDILSDSQDLTPQVEELDFPMGTENVKEAPLEDIEDTTQSLLELCAKYGLDDLKFTFLSNSISQMNKLDGLSDQMMLLETGDNKDTDVHDALRKKENLSELESLDEGIKSSIDSLSENPDRDTLTSSSHLRRSVSLPSTFQPFPDVDTLGHHHGYIDMSATFGWINEDTKPHEMLLKNAVSCEELKEDNTCASGLSNHIYMSMKFPEEEPGQKTCLSDSQQELLELMHHFKRGDKTISQVERQFQEWHLKHRTTVADRKLKLRELRNTYGKAQKNQSYKLPDLKKIILRKPKRKESKEKPQGNDSEKTKTKQKQEKQDTKLKRSSKASDTSISSGCSANSNASDASHGKFDPTGEDKMMNSFYQGISPTNNFHYCPMFQECVLPPPPPFKPPPTPTEENDDPYCEMTNRVQRRKRPIPLPRRTIPPKAPPSPDYIVPVDHVEYANTFPNRCIKTPNTSKPDVLKPTFKLSEPKPSRLHTVDDRRKNSAPDIRKVLPLVTPPIRVHDTAAEQKHRKNPHHAMFYVARRSSSDPQMRVLKIEAQPTYLELCRDSRNILANGGSSGS